MSHLLFLQLVSAVLYQIFIFSSSDGRSKTMKNVFYFILKALFVLEIFKCLLFFPFLSTLSRFKRANGGGFFCFFSYFIQTRIFLSVAYLTLANLAQHVILVQCQVSVRSQSGSSPSAGLHNPPTYQRTVTPNWY